MNPAVLALFVLWLVTLATWFFAERECDRLKRQNWELKQSNKRLHSYWDRAK